MFWCQHLNSNYNSARIIRKSCLYHLNDAICDKLMTMQAKCCSNFCARTNGLSNNKTVIDGWVVYEHVVVQALAQYYIFDKQPRHCHKTIKKTVWYSLHSFKLSIKFLLTNALPVNICHRILARSGTLESF
jgi:hypothetical protein